MANKILIFGATGAVGSSLAKLMQNGSTECHLVGKNQDEVSRPVSYTHLRAHET